MGVWARHPPVGPTRSSSAPKTPAAPWHAPLILGLRAICVPLACGNTVVLKGSENCPRTHQLIVRGAKLLCGGKAEREPLINSPHPVRRDRKQPLCCSCV